MIVIVIKPAALACAVQMLAVAPSVLNVVLSSSDQELLALSLMSTSVTVWDPKFHVKFITATILPASWTSNVNTCSVTPPSGASLIQLVCTKLSPGNSVTVLLVLKVDELLKLDWVLPLDDVSVLLVLKVLLLSVLLLTSALMVL